jgi:hypothetical protein
MTQTELERKIITGRARQRYVRTTLFLLRQVFTDKFSSPSCLKSKTLVKMKWTRAAFCVVRATSSVDTSHSGEARSSWSMAVHRC